MPSLSLVLIAVFVTSAYSQSTKHARHELSELQYNNDDCVVYNVYYPQNCRGEECMLAVSWEPHHEWVEFHLMGKPVGKSVWIALGISKDGNMADSDIVTCWYHDSQFSIHSIHSRPFGHSIDNVQDTNVSKVGIQLLYANYSNGVFSCNFNKLKTPLNYSIHEKSLDENWHVLLAWGQLYIDKKIVMKKHAQRYNTECNCNLTDCMQTCLCINHFRELLLKLHGSVMIIAFVFVLPTAALIARHYRQVFHENWFKSHMTLMTVGVLGILSGLGFILGHTGPHQIIGILTIGAAVLQVVIAIFRPHVGSSPQRKLFQLFHRLNAFMILLLGTAALFLGVWLLHGSHQVALLWMGGLLAVGFTTSFLFAVLLELKSFLKICQGEGIPVQYHKLEQPSINETESEDEVYVKENEQSNDRVSSPYFKEKVIFLLFILQSFTITGLLLAFTFYEVPNKHDS